MTPKYSNSFPWHSLAGLDLLSRSELGNILILLVWLYDIFGKFQIIPILFSAKPLMLFSDQAQLMRGGNS